jgi:glycosyltransferase involved in cell wall biosynthesis
VPRVSVIIPAYNAAATIAGTVDSVIAQSLQDFEIICVDDGSTDDTLAIMKQFGDRVRLLEQSNSGPATGRNNGARSSSGGYLAFLDADDVWTPQFLERGVATLDADPALSLVYCNCALADSEGVPIDT